MKYIISESKLEKFFSKVMETTFDLENLHYTELDENFDALIFYFGDYSDDNVFGRFYTQNYFYVECDDCPYMDLEHETIENLNIAMGDFNNWGVLFIEWFNKQYPNFKIKTVKI